jgi:hypothetical protein
MRLALFLPVISFGIAGRVLLACLGSFLVAASILAVNDWADIKLDSQHSLKRKDTFLERGINPNQMLALAVSLAAGGMIFFAAPSGLHVVMALVALVVGLAYFVPVGALRGIFSRQCPCRPAWPSGTCDKRAGTRNMSRILSHPAPLGTGELCNEMPGGEDPLRPALEIVPWRDLRLTTAT